MTRHLRVWIFAVASATAAASVLPAEQAPSPPLGPNAMCPLGAPPSSVLHLKTQLPAPRLSARVRKHLEESETYRKAWERMAPEERKQVLALFRQAVGPALHLAVATHPD